MSVVSWLAAFITIASLTGYHVVQKIMPQQTNAAMVLFFTYGIAAFLSLLLLLFYPDRQTLALEFAKFNQASAWPIVAFGAAVFGVEFGYLLAYRMGWKLSTTSAIMNTISIVLLFTLAIVFFREEVTARKCVGLVLAAVGVLLLK